MQLRDLVRFARLIGMGMILAILTAFSLWSVGNVVSRFLEPNDWFCRAITIVSHSSAFITFVLYVIRDFVDVVRAFWRS
jgi:hypothetical protein